MILNRNTIYPLKDLASGDRFHYPGKKTKLGEVIDQVFEENAGRSALPIKTKVMLDGQQFSSLLNPEKEVVYLRSK